MNTTVFTLVNAVLLRGLPYQNPGEIVYASGYNNETRDDGPASWPGYEDWKADAKSFRGLAAMSGQPFNLSGEPAAPECVSGMRVTPNVFGLLGQPTSPCTPWPGSSRRRREESFSRRSRARPGLTLTDRLQSEGYHVEHAADGATAFERATAESFDVILLDVMLPGASGFDVCRDVRNRGALTPIIMLTARGQVADKVVGLKLAPTTIWRSRST